MSDLATAVRSIEPDKFFSFLNEISRDYCFSDLRFDPGGVSNEKKDEIRNKMISVGIPKEFITDDSSLSRATKLLMGRAIKLAATPAPLH